MTELEKKLIDYANAVIDNMCESQGVDVAIDDLIAFGFTKEELTEGLSFDSDDVNEYLGETDDDYDDEDEELHKFTVKCHDIDYDVGWEDVDSNFDVPTDLDDDDLDNWYDLKVEEIIATLPKEVILTVEATEDDELEDVIVEALSEETGWLINSYQYDIID